VCHDLRPGDVFYGAGEWAWSMAKLMGPLRAGAIQFVYRPAAGFDPIGLLEATARNGVSNALVNPTFLRKLRAPHPTPAAVSAGVPGGVLCQRAAHRRSDRLVPRTVRRDDSRLLRFDGVLSTGRKTSPGSR